MNIKQNTLIPAFLSYALFSLLPGSIEGVQVSSTFQMSYAVTVTDTDPLVSWSAEAVDTASSLDNVYLLPASWGTVNSIKIHFRDFRVEFNGLASGDYEVSRNNVANAVISLDMDATFRLDGISQGDAPNSRYVEHADQLTEHLWGGYELLLTNNFEQEIDSVFYTSTFLLTNSATPDFGTERFKLDYSYDTSTSVVNTQNPAAFSTVTASYSGYASIIYDFSPSQAYFDAGAPKEINPGNVPEPRLTAALIGLLVLGFSLWRRRSPLME